MNWDIFLTRFRDLMLGAMAIGIIIGLTLVMITQLGPIKTHTGSIPSISTGITRIEQNTQGISSINKTTTTIAERTQAISSIKESVTLIGQRTDLILSIRDDVKYLKTKAETEQALISSEKGGKLAALDWYTTINIKPNAVSNDTWFKYNPLPTEELPPQLPPLMKPVGYNFALTPYSPTGVKLSDLFFKEPVEVSIAYTNLNLDLTTNKLTDLTLQRWDDKQKKWMPVKTTINGEILHAETSQPGYFVLGFSELGEP